MRNWLGKWNRHKVAQPARDPLLAVPRVPAGVAVEATATGMMVSRCLPPGRGAGGWLVRRLGGALPVRVALDERGMFYWRQIDGQRSLAAIAGELQAQFGLDAAAARWCLMEFTKQLMRRGLVELKIEP